LLILQNLKMSKCVNQHALRVLLVHPGTQHAPRLAAELHKRGLLWRFWTGVASPKERGNFERSHFDILKERKRRRVVDVPLEQLRTIGWVEMLALLMARLPVNREKLWHWRNGLFQKLVPQHEIEAADVVVGFDTSAWIIGERAKRAGKKFVLDQSVGHPLSRAKAVREAGGDETMWPDVFVSRTDVVKEAEAQEHALADMVVVASSFSKRTLVENGVAEEKTRVLPYGVGGEFLQAGAAKIRGAGGAHGAHFDRDNFEILKDALPATKPFWFLYAGYLTKRKGIDVLLRAWSALQNVEHGALSMEHGVAGQKEGGARGGGREVGGSGQEASGEGGHFSRDNFEILKQNAELRLVGGGEQPEPLPQRVVCLGQTPREALLREMSEADVFVFPSLFEGFALVILEAMAAGLPVITTPNTAGPDLIEHGKEGLIVPAGDVKALQTAMESLLNDPERARAMGRAAHEKAKEYTWERYGERWEALVREVCREQA
jgi:starch synthase